ncbi:TPA: hypothetical protein ACXAMQ_001345 [Klebsiella pneumoniae]|uniref:hypothetical protein n=1 Tax=Klebsiella quasipneumoniae TaxID=1463165 RepID=UPI0015DC1E4D|nr:hypothetical protein [Klebsiella quasipneumoniae]BBQ67224.1 hypothetical protein WP3W18C02_20430 [Klebsiella quasipneumoniae]BBR14714.1 hypothetical protein WP3S18E03_19720 [Klebsiella quasipneumoniae]
MSQAPLNAPETKLATIIDSANRNRMGLTEARSRISVLLDSLRGIQPVGGSTEKAVSPDGSLNQLHEVLNETESSTVALHADLDELFSLLGR